MEKVYKITIELESTDEADIAEALDQIADEIREGDVELPVKKHTTSGNVDSVVEGTVYERCEDCKGEGEVMGDSVDRDGNVARGAGYPVKCQCQIDIDSDQG